MHITRMLIDLTVGARTPCQSAQCQRVISRRQSACVLIMNEVLTRLLSTAFAYPFGTLQLVTSCGRG
eukprot:29673-Eustigmatos_ZCMA.PRE.1